jgi:AcrR family transcriptional regulator
VYNNRKIYKASKTMNNDRRVKRTKKNLKRSLISLLQLKPLKDISIAELAAHADYNRSTFYKHYQSKEDLLNELIDDVIDDLILSYREPYQNKDAFVISELSYSAIKIFDHFKRYQDFYKLVFKTNVIPDCQNRICDELKKLAILDLIDDSASPQLDRELQASYQSNAILGFIKEWINRGFKHSPHFMAEQLLEIVKINRIDIVYKVNNPAANK